jgi:hypothetical protein
MRKYGSRIQNFCYFLYRWIRPVIDPLKVLQSIPGYISFFKDWIVYSRLPGAEKMTLRNSYPCVHDRTATTQVDSHYFYQDIWALKKVHSSGVSSHVDVGSRTDFVGFLSALCHVTFIDIRPLSVQLEHLEMKRGSALAMPYGDASVSSLSCLHVAEHIGLGRYGDPLDPEGTINVCRELARILEHGGNLYFSMPVGLERLCFNAHRIHSPRRVLEFFSSLTLVELSGIDDGGSFIRNIDISVLEHSHYACGLFHFRKPLPENMRGSSGMIQNVHPAASGASR